MDNLFETAKQQVAERCGLRYENGVVTFPGTFDTHAYWTEVFELGCNITSLNVSRHLESCAASLRESGKIREELNTFEAAVAIMSARARFTNLPYPNNYVAHRQAMNTYVPENNPLSCKKNMN